MVFEEVASYGFDFGLCVQPEIFDNLSSDSVLQFHPKTISEFPKIKRREFFGEMRPDNTAFTNALSKVVQEWVGEHEILKSTIFYRSHADTRMFVFLKNRAFYALELRWDGVFGDWISEMTSGFGDEARLDVQNNGSSMGRILPDVAEWLDSNHAKLVKKISPKVFRKRELDHEKIDFFNFDQVDAQSKFDEARFETALGNFTAKFDIKSKRTSTAKGFKALEKKLGAPLPEDFKAFYKRVNGKSELLFGFDLLSLDSALQELNNWTWIFDDWSLEDLQSSKTADEGVWPIYCCPRWVPFVDLVGGHYLFLDTAPIAPAPYGQVILAGRDIGRNRVIASSVTEFLEKCVDYDNQKSHELYSVFGELLLWGT